jgi:ABC-type transport system involved in multi-copper enzyme maturation permease subunit
MIRAFRAELARLARRRMILWTLAAGLVFAVAGPLIVLASVKPARETTSGTPSIETLSGAGGGSEIFRFALAFTGTLIFVVFIGVTALEFSRGTVRTMLLRQPQRLRLLAGRLLAMLSFAAATLAFVEVAMWIAARLRAPGIGISTSDWISVNGLGAAASDYGMVLVWMAGYAVLGTAVGLLVRSVPIALGIGIAWAGPFEHLVQNAWNPATKVFPGLLLEVVGQGGTADVSLNQALLSAAGYAVVAAAVAAIVFTRRDVTA